MKKEKKKTASFKTASGEALLGQSHQTEHYNPLARYNKAFNNPATARKMLASMGNGGRY